MLTTIVASALACLILAANLTLFWKILVRPSVHSLYNIITAINLFLGGIISPFLVYYYVQVINSDDRNYGDFDNCSGEDGEEACQERNDRQYDCFMLYLIRCCSLFFSCGTLWSNLMFRYLQIKYADYGLVVRGHVNTLLRDVLYFIIVSALFTVFVLVHGGVYYYQYDKPHNFITGRFCNRIEMIYNDEDYQKFFHKKIEIMFTGQFVNLCMVSYFNFRVKKFIKNCCPTGKSSSLGGNHNRNLLTFRDVSNFFYITTFQATLHSIVCILMYYYQKQLSTQDTFYISFSFMIAVDLYNNLYTPVKWIIRSRTTFVNLWIEEDVHNYRLKLRRQPFYVRKEISPRRDLLTIRKAEIYRMYSHENLETIAEEWPNNHYVWNMKNRDWKNTLKKVPTNGELFIRKKVVPRYNIPEELAGLPGWQVPSTWETRLEDKGPIRTTQKLKPFKESYWLPIDINTDIVQDKDNQQINKQQEDRKERQELHKQQQYNIYQSLPNISGQLKQLKESYLNTMKIKPYLYNLQHQRRVHPHISRQGVTQSFEMAQYGNERIEEAASQESDFYQNAETGCSHNAEKVEDTTVFPKRGKIQRIKNKKSPKRRLKSIAPSS